MGPVFLEPAFAVRRARIRCISVFNLATTGGVGLLRLVMTARIVYILFFGSLDREVTTNIMLILIVTFDLG